MLSASRTLAFSGDAISRATFFADYRKYQPLFYRNYFAVRGIGALGVGDDPQIFFLGGPLTMRGYDYLQFSGSRILLVNAEYRYPLVDAIIFGWPGRWAIQDIGGTLFLDSGSVWGKGRYVEPLPSWLKPRVVNDLAFYSDFGLGFYMRIGYLILNFQLGWPTDFARTGDSMFHFFIGPQF
jgi:outer membrane protein assembly factor BamA